MADFTINYLQAGTLDDSDRFLISATNGVLYRVTGNDLKNYVINSISPEMHRNVYRGKHLGTSITAAQQTAISAGTFDDLFIGDYWVINDNVYAIADMDYWYGHGSTNFDKHHLVMIPAANLYDAKMNVTDTTAGAYVGSSMHTGGLNTARTQISTDFGNNLLTHSEFLENATTEGVATDGVWIDSTVDLMSETMLYGQRIRSTSVCSANSKSQLAIFKLKPNFLGRSSIWLRDVVSATSFASLYGFGGAYSYSASSSRGVRPVFAVGV